MSTEDQILKGTKLITNTEAKIKNLEQRLDSEKYNNEKTIKSITKIVKNI